MKTKRFLALLTALVMVMAIVPGLAFAADGDIIEVVATKSMTANILDKKINGDTINITGRDANSLYVYHANWNQRNAYVGFDLKDRFTADQLSGKTALQSATLSVNCLDAATIGQPTVSLVAIDNTIWSDDKYPEVSELGLPAYNATGESLTEVPEGMTVIDEQDITKTGVYEFDVTDYVRNNLDTISKNGASFALISITKQLYIVNNEKNLEALKVLFEGKNGTTKPKLTLKFGEVGEVVVSLKSGNTELLKTTVNNLVIGDKYTPTEELAPAVVISNGKIYTRKGNLTETTVAKNTNVSIEYDEGVTITAEAFEGGMAPMLPTVFKEIKEGKIIDSTVKWVNTDGKYSMEGVTGVTVDVTLWKSEYTPEIFYCSGTSNGANFGWKTDLKYNYSAGHAIFEAIISTKKGTAEDAKDPSNRLLSYGNSSTGSFDGTGPIMRYLNNKSVFEYHDGGWKDSTVTCEAEKTYIIHTEVNLDDKTYRMYAEEQDTGVINEITNGPAKFRNQELANIDRVFFHGDDLAQGVQGDPNGCPTVVILNHLEAWQDGYTEITVTYKAGETEVSPTKTTKAATDSAYVENGVEKLVKKDGKLYILKDVNAVPAIENVDADHNVLNVEYTNVEAETPEIEDANTVVGQAPVLPATVNVPFSDGQYLPYSVKWNDVDVSAAGTKTASGTIEELDLNVTCTVNIKSIVPDDGSELGKVSIATNNGGWNWYVEPSGTHIQPGDDLASRYEGKTKDIDGNTITYTSNNGYVFQHDKTYMGWVEDCGDIVVAEYDHDTDEYKRVVIHEKLESDDHNNPAVVVLPDGRIMAVYTMHTNEPYMYFRVTKEPEDITKGWWPEQYYYCKTDNNMEANSHDYNATYPTIFLVHDDPDANGDVIYAGWRGVHWKPTMAKFPMPDEYGRFGTKTDGEIVPVMGQTQVANTSYSSFDDGGRNDGQRRPYTKYDYDCERNKIYITYTANHPDNDKRNHIYYMTLDIATQMLLTASGNELQPLPKENKEEYKEQGALDADGNHTNGQWGVMTVPLHDVYPDLVVFDASQLTGASFTDFNGINNERRGWTWDIAHNEKGEPCIVYADITATPPGENGELPTWYQPEVNGNTRSHHYYWYARWDSEANEWVNTFLTYGGKWFHQNATQERCYSGGLTFDHNAKDANVIYLSIPTEGEYGNVFEIYRWESDDHGATWTKRQALTKDSPVPNARPNAIYNYKMNDDGTNAGPRLLWISGEYRYWMNYEYKTGVKTDFPDMVTQDDPEMFADAALEVNGEEIDKLPTGETTFNGKFVVSNTSIGDGQAKFALAHYDSTGKLIKFETEDREIPARSVPQTSLSGADKDSNRGNGLSAMGDPQVEVNIPYTANIKAGDKIKLFAWNMGIEHPMSPIIAIPVEISTDGSKYLYAEDFTFEAEDKLMLDKESFNEWTGKIYDSNGVAKDMNDSDYAAVAKTAFGNSGIHLYRVDGDASGQGVMASHSLPTTDGKDFTLEFDMRYINEWSWNDVQNVGFTLSHGVPEKIGDTDHPSAIQFRQTTAWGDENGRNNTLQNRASVAFDSGNLSEIGKYTTLYRVDNDPDPDRYTDVPYHNKGGSNNGGGAGRYDTREVVTKNTLGEVYIHDYVDSLMVGALYHVTVDVHPSVQLANITVFDGYRAVECVVPFNTGTGVDWEANPIDTISFSIGQEKWGELYVDNIKMYLSEEGSALKTVEILPVSGTAMTIGSTWNMLPIGDAYVFFNPEDGKVMEVASQSTVVGGTVGTWDYNGGDNQKFYLEETEGGYYLKGKQSNLYIGVDDTGATTLKDKADATVFTVTETGEPASAAVLEIVEMIEDGTYEATISAVFDEE